MRLRGPGHGEVVIGERPLSRLLLEQQQSVGLQEVHTPLHAQHLGKERRFHHHLVGLEAVLHDIGQPHVYRVIDVLRLPLRVAPHLLSLLFRHQRHCQRVVLHEMAGGGTQINASFAGVQRIVQHLASQITQRGGRRGRVGLQFLYEAYVGRGGVLLETGRDVGYVHQVVGLVDDKLRADFLPLLHPTGAHEVHQAAGGEEVLEVGPVVVRGGEGHPYVLLRLGRLYLAVEPVVVPRRHQHPHTVGEGGVPYPVAPALLGEQPLQAAGDGHAID